MKGLTRTRRVNYRILLSILLPILAIAAAALFFHLLLAPVHGHTVATRQNLHLVSKTPPQSSETTVSLTLYYSLNLPRGYSQQAVNQSVAGLLSTQTIIKAGAEGSQIISIAIQSLPDGGLTALSAYQLRTQQPSRFSASNLMAGTVTVPFFSDTQSAVGTLFWAHGSRVATISVTTALTEPGADNSTREKATLQPLLSGWQWR